MNTQFRFNDYLSFVCLFYLFRWMSFGMLISINFKPISSAFKPQNTIYAYDSDRNATYLLIEDFRGWNLLDVTHNTYYSYSSILHWINKLQILHAYNPQTNFPTKIFEIVSYLQDFAMTDFAITHFKSEDLIGANHLLVLNMSHNSIESLQWGAFVYAPEIKIIDFSHNQIKDIEDGYDKVPLQEIYLNNNKLTFLTFEWFQGLDHLRVLTLNDNSINHIDSSYIFSPNQKLEMLHLQNNQLKYHLS